MQAQPTARVRSEDFTRYVPYRVNTSSEHYGWRGFRVEVVRDHAPGELSLPPLDHHLLNLIVSAQTRHDHRWDGLAAEGIGDEGTASLVPAGRESYWRWRYLSPGPSCDFHLHLHPAFVRRVAVNDLHDLPRQTEFHGELCFAHPELRVLALSLLRETEAGGQSGSLYAESIATAIVTLLLNRQQPPRLQQGRKAKALPAERMRTVCDYIETHLGQDLHLETLCELAGLGPERLRECFRQSLGESPHRYVARRKIERATEILRQTALPLTEIALRLGYADHSHFTSAFRRELGVTPSRYRSESRR